MTREELHRWAKLEFEWSKHNDEMSKSDYQELLRLNHKLLEACQKIHNDGMLKDW